MKAQHTQGQLTIEPRKDGAVIAEIPHMFNDGPTLRALSTIGKPCPTTEAWNAEQDANASRLCACWNCHDELVNILQRMVDESLGGGKPCPCTIEHAMSALSKAKGE